MKCAYLPYFLDPAAARRHAEDILKIHPRIEKRRWWHRRDRCANAWHRGVEWPCRYVKWADAQLADTGIVYMSRQPA